MQLMTRETDSQKADRLVANHRVILIGRDDALVIGDRSTHRVTRSQGPWACDCPWGRSRGHWKACCHVVAVRRAWKDPGSQAPIARLADLLLRATQEGGWE